MKTTLLFTAFKLTYKFTRRRVISLVIMAHCIFSASSYSQCTNYTVNWDNLDFLHNTSGSWYNVVPPGGSSTFVTNTMKQSQNFAIGPTNMLTIATTIPVTGSSPNWGEITTHTGETGAYGTGADLAFIKVGTVASTITLTFLNEVTNVRFSVFDIDQEITFAPTATNAGGSAVSITLTKPAGTTSTIPLTATYPSVGANVASVTGTAPAANWTTGGGSGTAYANTSNLGTVNVDITNAVKTITLTFLNDGNTNDFWLSDITACSPNPTFSANYYLPYTEPYTGQPGYVLVNPNNNLNVYMVDPVNATADLVFTDPGTALGAAPAGIAMNSLAYDPVNHWLYYVMNGATVPSQWQNRSLKKYDVTTNTISTVIDNLNTLGIPTFTQGIEAAAAAFYDGALYLGVEGLEPSSLSTNTESIMWRIDFDPTTFAAIRASQVMGLLGDAGGQPTHDWGDFIIRNGTIVSHASSLIFPTYQSSFVHFNMQTETITNTYTAYADTAGQLGQLYNAVAYRIDNRVMLYNENGTTGAASNITVTSCSPSWNNNPANDVSCPFRPALDFGDAPSSYDPVALSPAANQRACNNSTLRIGSAWDREWILGTSADATGDGPDEDGITTVTTMVSDGIAYNHVQDVIVLNNTGATAYLAGWLDYDADGVFEASEGVVVTVPSSASPQTISLGWAGITVAIGTPNSFLRVRLYSGVLTTSNATGWLTDGETEDYPVISQAMPLVIRLLDFKATLTTEKNVLLNWRGYADNEASGFEIERSKDQNIWEKIGSVNINTSAFTADYSFLDQQPMEGTSYYRLKMIEKNGSSRYSSARIIQIDYLVTNLRIYPNPVKNDVTISFSSTESQQATLIIRSLTGDVMIKKPIALNTGENRTQFSMNRLSNGLYIVELVTNEKTFINKLTVSH